jgi:hypothetical protein
VNRSMPTKLRWSILQRDGFRCTYCGRAAADGVVLHVDHIQSWADGGTDDPSNLTAACEDCNLGKRALSLPSIDFGVSLGATCETRRFVAFLAMQLGMHNYHYAYEFAAQTDGIRLPPRDRRLDRVAYSAMRSQWADGPLMPSFRRLD